MCDSAHRSSWPTRSPRTARCSWIPGKDFPRFWQGPGRGGRELPRKEEPGPSAAGPRQDPGEGGCDPGHLSRCRPLLSAPPCRGDVGVLPVSLTETQRDQVPPEDIWDHRTSTQPIALLPESPLCVRGRPEAWRGGPKPQLAPPLQLCDLGWRGGLSELRLPWLLRQGYRASLVGC